MARDPVVVTGGTLMHMRVTRVYHRHYPEAGGEGRSLREAMRRLERVLARCLDHAQGRGREEIKRALAEVGRSRRARLRRPAPEPTAAPS